jgi:hypothetical protein
MSVNIEQTIISQYGNSPRILAIVNGMNGNIQPDADIDGFYDAIFNVATANLFGLAIWSRIVGIPQALITALETYLDDADTFRSLVMLKALSNILYPSSQALNQLLQNWLGAGSRAYVQDLGKMTMAYVFEFPLTAAQTQILQNSGIFLHPSGVLVTIIATEFPVFGFAEMGSPWVVPFNQGTFYAD